MHLCSTWKYLLAGICSFISTSFITLPCERATLSFHFLLVIFFNSLAPSLLNLLLITSIEPGARRWPQCPWDDSQTSPHHSHYISTRFVSSPQVGIASENIPCWYLGFVCFFAGPPLQDWRAKEGREQWRINQAGGRRYALCAVLVPRPSPFDPATSFHPQCLRISSANCGAP